MLRCARSMGMMVSKQSLQGVCVYKGQEKFEENNARPICNVYEEGLARGLTSQNHMIIVGM